MKLLAIRRMMAVSVLVALGAAALIGCASLPTGPLSETHAGNVVSPDIVRVAPQGTPAAGPGDVAEGTTQPANKTVKPISGNVGGSVRKGRFTVDVPSGAFDGEGEISVSVPDSAVLLVDLHIRGVPNHFDVPVRLEVSVAGMESQNLNPAALKIFWHDEKARVWRELPTTFDPQGRVISTPLEHFSTYGVIEAKAGW